MSSEGQKVFGITGLNSYFQFAYCENDRLWRKQAGITPERYQKNNSYAFDECDNAFAKPSHPVRLDMLEHLFKRSDFSGMEE
eukprot:403340068